MVSHRSRSAWPSSAKQRWCWSRTQLRKVTATRTWVFGKAVAVCGRCARSGSAAQSTQDVPGGVGMGDATVHGRVDTDDGVGDKPFGSDQGLVAGGQQVVGDEQVP